MEEGLKKEKFLIYNTKTDKDVGHVLRISGVSDEFGEISMYSKYTTPSKFLKDQSKRIPVTDSLYKIILQDEELKVKSGALYLYDLKAKYTIRSKKRTLVEENVYLKEIVKKLKQKSDEDDQLIESLNKIIYTESL